MTSDKDLQQAAEAVATQHEAPVVAGTVTIVGRPNVGKSTLFNRLVARRRAIVHDLPGVTRDRISERAEVQSGIVVDLVDTGGLLEGQDTLGLNEQVRFAALESDVVLMVVDGREGLVAADREVLARLRQWDREVILVINKSDTKAAIAGFDEFYELGVEEQVAVSAEHGLGFEELRDVLLRKLPKRAAVTDEHLPALAIVGRPNVGKSSILNRLLDAPRALVSPQAGTTRDPIDTLLERPEGSYRVIDTAGIRRRSQVSGQPEELAVMMAKRSIDRADIVALVIDAEQGVTSGDLGIAGAIWEQGRAAVVVINKWDLLDDERRRVLESGWERLERILVKPPRVNVSALTGRGMERLLPAVDALLQDYRCEVGTAEVNRIFERAVSRHGAPSLKGRPWKYYYATQLTSGPPTFLLFVNRVLPRTDTYRRYLENQLRQALKLPGVPIRLVLRRRSG